MIKDERMSCSPATPKGEIHRVSSQCRMRRNWSRVLDFNEFVFLSIKLADKGLSRACCTVCVDSLKKQFQRLARLSYISNRFVHPRRKLCLRESAINSWCS